ncbi:hypothetical protein ACFOY2_32825 [Nonomuraea purpurea]|uniref:Uncharacterized protein n=1 Tax=Nonomuraea purpurea TaxID=1849276 RepID=A0ABV8GE47_9ACTN
MNARSSAPPAPRLADIRSRRLLGGFAALDLPDSVAAGHAYLDLVEKTLG